MTIQEFDYNIDLMQTILWQYNDATTLQSIIQSQENWLNENNKQFWDEWYTNIFNIETCNEFGASLWSIILGISFAQPKEIRITDIFGFGIYNSNFYQSNFSPINEDGLSLSIEQKRLVLQLRYLQLTSNTSIFQLNPILKKLFGYNVYILDGLDMSISMILTEYPDLTTNYIINNFDVIPRPAGVKLNTTIVTGFEFGFSPFGNNFYESYFGG